jgi:hypothetical protein
MFTVMILLDLAGFFSCLWLQMQCRTVERSWWLRTGIGLFGLGVLFQAFRNLQFLVTGVSPTDAQLPLWALKDIGGTMVALWAVYMLTRQTERLGKIIRALVGGVRRSHATQPEPKPTPRRRPAETQVKPKPALRRAAPAIKPTQRKAKA